MAGFAYLALIGTALAYTLWFRGIQLLPVGSVTFLGLLSPVVAVLAGWAFLAQTLSWGQILGTATILVSLICVFTSPTPHSTDAEMFRPAPALRPGRQTIGRLYTDH